MVEGYQGAIHSPLGASGMKRWEACVFSVWATLRDYDTQDEEESEHAALGTAAHSVIERCMRDKIDAWTLSGQPADESGILVDADMISAAQTWLDLIRSAHPDRNQGNHWIERRFHCPSIHRLFFGTSDFTYLDYLTRTLHVWDYKHGIGVVVEAKDNPQGMYYASGVLEELGLWDLVDKVVIHIVQPRAFHSDGVHREWEIPTEFLVAWVEDHLIPTMIRAEAAMTLHYNSPTEMGVYRVPDPVMGDHCQFCPARGKCPAHVKNLEALEGLLQEFSRRGVADLTPEERARFKDVFDRARTFNKANDAAIEALFASGKKVPGFKQVPGKVDRAWPDKVRVGETEVPFDAFAKEKFGANAFTEPKLKSPAQIEKLPLGVDFARRHAFKPQGGLVVVRDTDSRPEVSRDTKSLFKPVGKKEKKS